MNKIFRYSNLFKKLIIEWIILIKKKMIFYHKKIKKKLYSFIFIYRKLESLFSKN